MNEKTTAPPERTVPASPKSDGHPRHHLEEPPKRASGKGWLWLIVLIVAGAVGYYYWSKGQPAQPATDTNAPGGKAGGKKGGRGAGNAPVVAVKARRGNIPVYVTDPGGVTPINTVVEKTRVDGELMKVYYKEGDIVHKGDPLVEIDPRPYEVARDQAEGQLARDQALLNNAIVDEQRYETLLKQNAIPEQQLATQKALVAQYIGTVKTDQAMIDSAKLNIEYCHIKAQVTGKVGLRLVDPGNIVHATDTNGLVVITQMQPISVIFPISQKDVPAVLRKFRAEHGLRVDALTTDPYSPVKLGTGRLVTIDNQIDPTTGTLKLRAEFVNADNALFPNEMVNARLLVEEKQNVVLLPSAAIQRSNNTYVWVVKPDNTVTVRNITEGTTEGSDTEVTSGLEPGETVVMTGVDRLTEGGKVTVQVQGGRGGTAGAPGNGAPPNGSTQAPAGAPSGVRKGMGRRGGTGQ
jgi:multidrug efflux system membrane fusion protein